MKLGLRYQTTCRYEDAVGLLPHEVRLFPRNDPFNRVRRLDFSISPKGKVRFWRDMFENTVASCFFPKGSRELEFRLAINLELDEKDPFHFVLENEATETPFEYEETIARLLASYCQRQTKDKLVLPGWVPPNSRNRRETVSTLVELNKRLHECIGYERRDEEAVLSPAETLSVGRGACRDVAVLLAEFLRHIGFAARLTSGYLRECEAETRRAEGSLHTWTEVFLPGAGWIGLDGTNGVFSNHNFIAAAVGLTAKDVGPLSETCADDRAIPAQRTTKLRFINL